MQRDSGCTSHGGTGDLVGLLSLCLRARLRVPLPPGDSEYPGAGPCFLPLRHPRASPHFPVKFGTSQGRSPRPCGCPGAGPHIPSPLGASTHVCLLELGLQALHGDSNLSPVAVSGGFGCPLGTSPWAVPVTGGQWQLLGGFPQRVLAPKPQLLVSPACPLPPHSSTGGPRGGIGLRLRLQPARGGPAVPSPRLGGGHGHPPNPQGRARGGCRRDCGRDGPALGAGQRGWDHRGLSPRGLSGGCGCRRGGQGWAQQGWHPLPLCGTPLCDTPLSGTPWPCLAPLFMAPPCLTALV